MVKKMIAERMTRIERSMGVENQERIASLERENTALKEYARKVEDSVKTILAAEKERAKLKVTRAIQTQDPHWVSFITHFYRIGTKLKRFFKIYRETTGVKWATFTETTFDYHCQNSFPFCFLI